MKRLFADSFYFIALLNERDACHHRAAELSRESGAVIITTRWVLAGVADALCAPAWRAQAGAFIEFALSAPGFLVKGTGDELFDQGMKLYRSRHDKGWSLTDCISFEVMAEMAISEALTGDRHFEQAGFKALLA